MLLFLARTAHEENDVGTKRVPFNFVRDDTIDSSSKEEQMYYYMVVSLVDAPRRQNTRSTKGKLSQTVVKFKRLKFTIDYKVDVEESINGV